MESQPDIVVSTPGEPTIYLVVEVKAKGADQAAVAALKRQMIWMRAPTGLLVTPELVSVYRDTFKSYAEESIESAGSVPTGEIPDLQRFAGGTPGNAVDLEDAVQEWLVQLQHRLIQGVARTGDLLPLLTEHVAPALVAGEVRTSGPRHTLHDA